MLRAPDGGGGTASAGRLGHYDPHRRLLPVITCHHSCNCNHIRRRWGATEDTIFLIGFWRRSSVIDALQRFQVIRIPAIGAEERNNLHKVRYLSVASRRFLQKCFVSFLHFFQLSACVKADLYFQVVAAATPKPLSPTGGYVCSLTCTSKKPWLRIAATCDWSAQVFSGQWRWYAEKKFI